MPLFFSKVFETSPMRLLGYSLEHKESDDIWRNFIEAEMPGICRKSVENPFFFLGGGVR